MKSNPVSLIFIFWKAFRFGFETPDWDVEGRRW